MVTFFTKQEAETLAKQTLKNYFNYDSFREIQQDVITTVLSGTDAMALLATGGGKTMLYTIPALIFDGVSIIISPLKALQKDQVDSAKAVGIPVELVNSDLGVREKKRILKALESKQVKMLYVSPETLLSDNFKPFLDLIDNIPFIAVDEAHVCSSWSDFRPDYQLIYQIREKIAPDAVMLCVTATADSNIKQEIVKYSGLKNNYQLFQSSFDRPNIHLNIVTQSTPVSTQILNIINKYPKGTKGLLYFNSKKKADDFAKYLKIAGYKALSYHAGMKKKLKEEAQNLFKKNEIDIICATIAFGMGIDIPDIRFCIHPDCPDSFDAYSQQIGRCSRDGERADAWLLYTPKSAVISQFLIKKSTFNPNRLKIKLQKLQNFHSFARSNLCRRKQLLAYFGEQYTLSNCKSCNICLGTKI